MFRLSRQSLESRLIAGGLFVALFLFSLGFYLFRPDPTVQRVLFFPDETTRVLGGELRVVPRLRKRESEVAFVLRELVLGPTALQFGRILPRQTGILSVLLRDNVLYVNLSDHLVFPAEEMLVDFDQMIRGIRKTIGFNYPGIEQVRFFILGVEV